MRSPKKRIEGDRAVLGSIERWIGILLENHGGALPLWLAPVQIAVASISEKSVDWAEAIVQRLNGASLVTDSFPSVTLFHKSYIRCQFGIHSE